uniref:Helically-extended SH3 domain-containing protein n=1 Tax=Monopterus albus TaxID=43700 RepID=A0A3Q3IVS1_MONAL|nr:uncharacterized protein LOC109970665 isoform X2 [Monopterus albus]
MEEDGAMNFKALRAKFQEEALAQSKTSRPAVAEKPKHLPPPGVHCGSVVSSINNGVEEKTPVVPQVIYRDGLRASGGKRNISFPPQPQQTSPSSHLINGDSTRQQSFKERHIPLVLPVLSVKEQKTEPPVKKDHKAEPERGKEVMLQIKIKKKGLLLPFKSAKTSKVSAQNGEEPAYADLTNRPSSAPGELPSVENQTTEDEVSLQIDQPTAEHPPSSPYIPNTSPCAQTNVDSNNRIMSTLERAKKKFTYRQILTSGKPKNLHSPDYTLRDQVFHSPPKYTESVEPDPHIPLPVCLPHLACISARPFFKASTSAHKTALDKQISRDIADLPFVRAGELHPPSVPSEKPLPDLRSLGPPPAKPLRPPLVDLLCYLPRVLEVSPDLNQAPPEEPESQHPSIPNPVLDAPEFPDFESSEMEIADGEAVDIAAIELEALDLVNTDLPDFGVTSFEGPQLDLLVCDPLEPSVSSVVKDLNLGSPNIIPLDPASFPEPTNILEFPQPVAPEQWSQNEEATVHPFSNSQATETDVGAAECQWAPEEMELGVYAQLRDGIQPHSSVYHQDSYCDRCDDVYEGPENANKFITSQNSRKRRAGLKNPYADNHSMKEEVCPNTWSRNPSKEWQSPSTADHKEQKKKEKQRLEKEKKEQKEREKKENEMKKKFKVTGDEEPLYHARVVMASKVRKHDLPVKNGDTVSIIRTTNCPKGKWLARDASHRYGYISVMNVELNIKEMLELGKKAKAAGRGGNLEGDTISIGSRSSNHPVLTSSFTDDSEEWSCEDEDLSLFTESHLPQQNSTISETCCGLVNAQQNMSNAGGEDLHTQTSHEALQKLAIFFQHNQNEVVDDSEGAALTNAEPSTFLGAVEEPPYLEKEVDFTELELLPPPPLFADQF